MAQTGKLGIRKNSESNCAKEREDASETGTSGSSQWRCGGASHVPAGPRTTCAAGAPDPGTCPNIKNSEHLARFQMRAEPFTAQHQSLIVFDVAPSLDGAHADWQSRARGGWLPQVEASCEFDSFAVFTQEQKEKSSAETQPSGQDSAVDVGDQPCGSRQRRSRCRAIRACSRPPAQKRLVCDFVPTSSFWF